MGSIASDCLLRAFMETHAKLRLIPRQQFRVSFGFRWNEIVVVRFSQPLLTEWRKGIPVSGRTIRCCLSTKVSHSRAKYASSAQLPRCVIENRRGLFQDISDLVFGMLLPEMGSENGW